MTKLEEVFPPKYKIGDRLTLYGHYKDDAIKWGKGFRGVVVDHFTDKQQLEIRASYNVYRVDCGNNVIITYGEAAWQLDY